MITVSTASSIEQARELLARATPPNDSATQRDNFSPETIERALALRFRRPGWVWFASDESGTVLGVVSGWGSAEVATPFVIDFLDLPVDNPDLVRRLLDRAVAESTFPGRSTIEIIHFLPTSTRLDDPGLAALTSALAGARFRLLVRRHRYRLDVRETAITIPATRLRFDSIERPDDPRLVAIMADILVGSLDAHDVDALRRADLATVATETVAEYLELDSFESMFLALDPTGEVVGLVIGGLRGSPERGTASFIGVSHRHRGHGYAAQLLGWMTKRMIGDGALFIVGETDDDNFPMDAAFTRVGYPHTESRIDFVRELPGRPHVNDV